VSDPSAYVVGYRRKTRDANHEWRTIGSREIDAGEALAPTAQVVVIRFTPVKKGQSIRLRISETYTAIGSYRLEEEDLVFDRSLGRPAECGGAPAKDGNVTASATPATVSEVADGRVRLDFWKWVAGPGGCVDQGEAASDAGREEAIADPCLSLIGASFHCSAIAATILIYYEGGFVKQSGFDLVLRWQSRFFGAGRSRHKRSIRQRWRNH